MKQISEMSFPVNVHMPKDRITQAHQGYGFIEFMGEEDADYAIKIMNMIKVYGKPIRVNKVLSFFGSDFRWMSKGLNGLLNCTVFCFKDPRKDSMKLIL